MDDDSEATMRPAWFDVLLADVDRVFEVTGAETPGWPDPHPSRSPLDEEYSRIADQGKYRILESRVDAWVQVLAGGSLATAVNVRPETWIAECRPPDQHLQVRGIEPVRPDGLALLLATTLVDDGPFGLDVGIGSHTEHPVFLTRLPFCGCDACDSGSANLLNELDGWVLTVARGGIVQARRGDDFATRSLDGWSATNGADSWLTESSAVPSGVERWAGASWVYGSTSSGAAL